MAAGLRLQPLVNKADFERMLAMPSWSRSAHFAVHHVAARPTPARRPAPKPAAEELSTSLAPIVQQSVDDLPRGHWLGSVVPKRHARRSVTRNLLKRQIRGAIARHAEALPPGLWLVRLRAPFPRAEFVSAASDALRAVARAELEQLFTRAAR